MKNLFALTCIAALTLVSIAHIYSSAYPLTNDKNMLSQAITDADNIFIGRNIDAYVLEIKHLRHGLAAFFQDRNNSQVFGFAFFERGLNRRYKLIETHMESIPYSSFVTVRSFAFESENFMVVGYNTGEIYSFGIQILGTGGWVEINGQWQRGFEAEIIFPVYG